MALVLVEGELQLAGLVGTQPNTTHSSPPAPSGTAISSSSDRTTRSYGAFVVVPLVIATFTLYASL
jgi:hypothetical protein